MLRAAELMYAPGPCIQSGRETRCFIIIKHIPWRQAAKEVFIFPTEARKPASLGIDEWMGGGEFGFSI